MQKQLCNVSSEHSGLLRGALSASAVVTYNINHQKSSTLEKLRNNSEILDIKKECVLFLSCGLILYYIWNLNGG